MNSVSSERLVGLIVGLAFTGALLTLWLVASELFREPTCPPLLGIPACYLVLAAYGMAAVGGWRLAQPAGERVLLTGAGGVTVIGIYFSVNQIRGVAECPTFEGLPMCFVSLLAGITLLALWMVHRRTAASEPEIP